MNVINLLEATPEWERLDLIKEIIPLLHLPTTDLMDEIVNQDKELQDPTNNLDDSEFIRYYQGLHPDIELSEVIADMREYEWEERK